MHLHPGWLLYPLSQCLTQVCPGGVGVGGGGDGFSPLVRSWGKGLTVQSLPVLCLKISSYAPTPLFFFFLLLWSESVYNGTANWDDYGRTFPDGLHVSSFFLIGSHTMSIQRSQPTPTSPGQERMFATCTLGRMTGVFYVLPR